MADLTESQKNAMKTLKRSKTGKAVLQGVVGSNLEKLGFATKMAAGHGFDTGRGRGAYEITDAGRELTLGA